MPRLDRYADAILGLLLYLACTAVGVAQQPMTDFGNAPPNGAYAFRSWTPATLMDLIKSPASGQEVSVVGHLFLPPGNAAAPAVVLMHGSGGIYEAMLDYWPKLLNAQGIAVFSLDTFGPRGVKSTANDQSLVPFAADVEDVFSALKLLATHPRIDPKRIAVMGFSRGGITAWRTAVEPIISAQQLPNGLRFAAHIQVYSGGCSGQLRLRVKPGVFAKEPMLWIHGDADNYCPISACREFAKSVADAGTPVEFVALPGAMHKFDSDDLRLVHLRSAERSTEDCPLAFDLDVGGFVDWHTGERLQGPAFLKARNACGAIGADVEGNRAARDAAGQAVVAFLRKVFSL